jgi:hypothetical protein
MSGSHTLDLGVTFCSADFENKLYPRTAELLSLTYREGIVCSHICLMHFICVNALKRSP